MNKNQNSEHAQNRDTFPLNVIWGALHLLRNSENSSWDVNGTHVFRAFLWKVPRNNGNLKKVVLFFRWKNPVKKHVPFKSFHKESPAVPGYSSTAISVLPS